MSAVTAGGSLADIPSSGPRRLWSLREMISNYLPIYNIVKVLQALLSEAQILRTVSKRITSPRNSHLDGLLKAIVRDCPVFGLTHTADLAKRVMGRSAPETYVELASELHHLDDSLSSELENESFFRIPPERKTYFEQSDLFGDKVAAAFPSCSRDIQRAGSCYALEQEDACVHHLMLVLERGLHALAVKVNVPYLHTNWQNIIQDIEKKLKSLPKGPDLYFYREVNAQFGYLKDSYRNHSEHTQDVPYDMPKALSILNHVRSFMQELAKGGLSE